MFMFLLEVDLVINKSLLLLVLCFHAISHASVLNFEMAKALANRDEKLLSATQLQSLTLSQGVIGGKILAGCFAASNTSISFALVMQLDASGKVVESWLDGASDGARCFREKMVGQKLFTPSFQPFYTVFEINLKLK